MTPERREELQAYSRAYYRQMTPEQLARKRQSTKRWYADNRHHALDQNAMYRFEKRDADPQGWKDAQRARAARAKSERLDRLREVARASVSRQRKRDPEKFRQIERRKYLKKHPLTREKQQILYGEITGKVPRTLPADVRDEVIARVFEGIMQGRFTRSVTDEEVKLVITEHFRQFSKFTTVSLDDIIADGASRGQLMGVY